MWFSCQDLPVRARCSICSFALDIAVYLDADWTKSPRKSKSDTHSKNKEKKSPEKSQLFLFPPLSKCHCQTWTLKAVVMVLFTKSHSERRLIECAEPQTGKQIEHQVSRAFLFWVLVCSWLTTSQERPPTGDRASSQDWSQQHFYWVSSWTRRHFYWVCLSTFFFYIPRLR